MKGIFRFTILSATLLGAATQANAGDIVYAPLGGSGEILVIDTARDSISGRISGLGNVHGLAITPNGKYLIAGSYDESEPGAALSAPKPEGVSKEAHQAHHGGSSSSDGGGGGKAVSLISVVRTSDEKIERLIEVPGAVHHISVTPDGRYAMATHPNGDGISVIDLGDFRLLKSLPTGPMPNYAVAGGNGKLVYVSNAGNGTVSEIDTERWVVNRDIAVGGDPGHMVLSPDGGTLYVNDDDSGTVSAVSLKRGAVAKTYRVGGGLHGIGISGDGKTLFVSAMEKGRLAAIDLAGGETRSAPLSPSPFHITAIGDSGKLYVSSIQEAKIWVVDQQSLRVVNEIQIPGSAHQMVAASE